MKRKLPRILGSLGLSDNEVKVYLGLLRTSQGSIPEIAKTSGINRTTVYSVLNQLIKRKLVHVISRASKNLYRPVSPYELLDRQLKIYSELETIVPTLERLVNLQDVNVVITKYQSDEELDELWDILLHPQSNVDSIIHSAQSPLINNEVYHFQFIRNRLKSNLHQRCLLIDSEHSKNFLRGDNDTFRSSVLCELNLNFDIHLFDKQVLLIPLDGMSGLRIRSSEIWSLLSELFSSLWLQSRKTNQTGTVTATSNSNPQETYQNRSVSQYELNFERLFDDLRHHRLDPRTVPIPKRQADLATFDLRDITLAKSMDRSSLVNFLDHGFIGCSYYFEAAIHDPQFRKNFPEAGKAILGRQSLIESLRSIDNYLAHYHSRLYLLSGHRTLSCQAALWDTYYEQAKKGFAELFEGKNQKKIAKEYTNRYISQVCADFSESDPSTWHSMSTGASFVLTLASTSGFQLELGVQHLELSNRSNPFYFEIVQPQTETEHLIRANRRLLFWASAINGWVCSPQHLTNLHAYMPFTTAHGLKFAELYGFPIHDKKEVNTGGIVLEN